MLQNADVFLADAIIFDLEDSVSISEKNNARNLVRNYLFNSSVKPNQVVLRTNSFDSVWFKKDMELFKSNSIDYLLIPKIDYDVIEILDEFLKDFEKTNNLEKIKIIGLVETAKGIEELHKYAQNKRLYGILLGAEDLTNDLGIKRTESGSEISYARSKVIYNCVANGLLPIDTPFTNVSNLGGLESDCLNSISLGMKAKASIHPNQLETINNLFSPSKQEVSWAMEVVRIHNDYPEKGVFQYQGKMIDKPIIEKAKRIIETAKYFDLI
jgi:citrate lyase subunit beta/citryl-CoA lyase